MAADLLLDDRLESSLADEVVPFMSRHPLYTYMDRGRRKSLLQPCAAYFRTWISSPGHIPAVPSLVIARKCSTSFQIPAITNAVRPLDKNCPFVHDVFESCSTPSSAELPL